MAASAFSAQADLLRAIYFAADKHQDQRRKNRSRSPYINHPIDVVHILWFEGQVHNPETLIAAVLHDTVEDTDTTFGEIEAHFGAKVCQIVREVTDDKQLDWGKRKARQIEKAMHLSSAAKLVVLGDKISNLRDVLSDPPEDWGIARQIAYFSWAEQVIQGVRGTHAVLESCFDAVQSAFRLKHAPT